MPYIQHFASCSKLRELFEELASIAKVVLPNAPGWRPDEKTTTIREAWALFALPPGEERPELGIVSLHLVIWKYIVYNLTLAETEGKAFETRHVWRAAWKCFKSKVDAKSIVLRRMVQRSESRGENVPDLTKYNRLTEPFALFDEGGHAVFDKAIAARVAALGSDSTAGD